MPKDRDSWLDDLLDQHPGQAVPNGFRSRLAARLADEGVAPQGRVLQPRWRKVLAQAALTAAAALLLVTGGYWLGAGQGTGYATIEMDPGGELAASEIQELYSHREILEAWEIATDGQLELLFQQTDSESVEGV